MNYRYGCTANTAGNKKRHSSAALALAVGLALAFPGSAALATIDPIPGIDIIVRKNPGAIIITVTPVNDAPGRFSVQLKEPGNYTISTACRLPAGCLPHTLSGALTPGGDGEPSIIAILIGLLLPAQKASAGSTSFNFTVGNRGVVLNGQFQDAAGVRVAAGDVNGDGVETRKAAPKKTSVGKLPGIMGEPIPGVDVNLGKNPGGSIVASSNTDNQGNFHFDQLPAGNYTLKLPGLPDQSLTVGADGIAGGKVMRGPDGSMSIFDRWGNSIAAPKVGTLPSKAAEKPVGFGSGMGAGPGVGAGMGPGGMGPGGMSPGGTMGPGGPMSPGGPMMGGPGGAMGGPKR